MPLITLKDNGKNVEKYLSLEAKHITVREGLSINWIESFNRS